MLIDVDGYSRIDSFSNGMNRFYPSQSLVAFFKLNVGNKYIYIFSITIINININNTMYENIALTNI